VDPDEEDDGEGGRETFDQGLKTRYEKALKESGGDVGAAARYIQSSQR